MRLFLCENILSKLFRHKCAFTLFHFINSNLLVSYIIFKELKTNIGDIKSRGSHSDSFVQLSVVMTLWYKPQTKELYQIRRADFLLMEILPQCFTLVIIENFCSQYIVVSGVDEIDIGTVQIIFCCQVINGCS